jgi:hypothetical protein
MALFDNQEILLSLAFYNSVLNNDFGHASVVIAGH